MHANLEYETMLLFHGIEEQKRKKIIESNLKMLMKKSKK